jgi:hypothetical protein
MRLPIIIVEHIFYFPIAVFIKVLAFWQDLQALFWTCSSLKAVLKKRQTFKNELINS